MFASFDEAEAAVRETFLRVRIGDGVIAEIATFGAGVFPEFGLPPTL